MASLHPSRQTLQMFLHGQLPQRETQAVVGHLLEDCPTCREVTGEGWARIIEGLLAARTDFEDADALRNTTGSTSPYRRAMDQSRAHALSEARSLEHQRAGAQQLFEELTRHPPKRRLTLVRNSRRFRSAQLCQLLAQEGFDQRFSDARWGVELTELAVAVGQELVTEDSRLLEGRAWAYHGNAQRVAGDLRSAERAFQQANQCFSDDPGDELDRALMHRFTALLMRARRDFAGARSRQDQAISLYLRRGETLQAANVMSDRALGVLYDGEPEAAIPMFEQALEIFTEEADQRSVATVRHNLAYCFAESGNPHQALEQVAEVRPLLEKAGDPLSLLRLRWLEGRIFTAQNRDREAEEALVEVCEEFSDRAIGYDAALVCLDLAGLYARQGRIAELRALAESMLPIFQSRDVHREAIAALVIFREAALAETVTSALVEEVSRFLHRARHDPRERFELP